MEVELLTKLGGEVNLLKSSKGRVIDIVLDPAEPMEEWAAPNSAGNRRGWVTLQHFPIAYVRFYADQDVKGVVPGEPSIVAIGHSCKTLRGRPDPWHHKWKSVTDSRGRAVREDAMLVSYNLALRPTYAATTASSQGVSALWAGLYAYPTGKAGFQEYVDDIQVEAGRPKNHKKLVWHDPPKSLKAAMEAGPSADAKTEMRRIQERWWLTFPKAEAAVLACGWPALGDDLKEWRSAHFPEFKAELLRESSWVDSITKTRIAARDAAAAERGAAAAAAARGGAAAAAAAR
eukprot:gene992-23735_t